MVDRASRWVLRRAPRSERWPASAGSPAASSSGARLRASPSSTTTPTCPPRWPPPSRPRETATGLASCASFQPHRYSRTEALWPTFADAFEGVDVLAVTDIYPSGEQPRPGVTGKLIVNAVLDAHPVAPRRLPAAPRRRGHLSAQRAAARRSVPHARRGRPHVAARRAADRCSRAMASRDRRGEAACDRGRRARRTRGGVDQSSTTGRSVPSPPIGSVDRPRASSSPRRSIDLLRRWPPRRPRRGCRCS